MRLRTTFSILLCLFPVFFFACVSGGTSKSNADIPVKGWTDNKTYRISGDGRPLAILTEIAERKKSSRNAAIMKAKFKLRQKFSAVSLLKPTAVSTLIDKEGKVIYERFDSEGGCEIIYEISKPGLKQMFPGVD